MRTNANDTQEDGCPAYNEIGEMEPNRIKRRAF